MLKPTTATHECDAYIAKLLSELSDRLANGPDHNHGDFLGFAAANKITRVWRMARTNHKAGNICTSRAGEFYKLLFILRGRMRVETDLNKDSSFAASGTLK